MAHRNATWNLIAAALVAASCTSSTPAKPTQASASLAVETPQSRHGKGGHRHPYCDRCTQGGAETDMQLYILAPAAASAATDYRSGERLLRGKLSTVMGVYRAGACDGASHARTAMVASATGPLPAPAPSDGGAVTFQQGPPPPRLDTPEALAPIPSGATALAAARGAHDCMPPLPATTEVCPAISGTDSFVSWDGVVYYRRLGEKSNDYFFVPCATNMAQKIDSYEKAARLDPSLVVHFAGRHEMKNGKPVYTVALAP